MDAAVINAVTNGVTDFKTDSLTQLAAIIPLGLAVMITVILVFKTISWFKKLAGLRAR